MKTVLIINSKGGSGKSTVATNLASFYASQNQKTALMDYDPQGTSLLWLKLRPGNRNKIFGADAGSKGSTLRSWRMNIPTDTDILIIDVPAGVEGVMLQETVRKADCIVIPVAPSTIDVHATADFIRDLLILGKVKTHKVRIAVVANRVRSQTPLYKPLERFLAALNLPFLGKLTDSDNYIEAFEKGLGVYELHSSNTQKERQELLPIIDWIKHPYSNKHRHQQTVTHQNIIHINSRKPYVRANT